MSFRLLTSQNYYMIRIRKNMLFTEISAWTKMSNGLKARHNITTQMNTKMTFMNSQK